MFQQNKAKSEKFGCLNSGKEHLQSHLLYALGLADYMYWFHDVVAEENACHSLGELKVMGLKYLLINVGG